MSQPLGRWLTTIVKFLVFIGLVAGGVIVCERIFNPEEEKAPEVASLDPIELGREYASPDRLLVINHVVPGSVASRQLSAILAKIDKERTYGDRVACLVLDAKIHRRFAMEQGVDLDRFSGQLDFFVADRKLGTLKGVTDPEVVHETIRTYLDGLIKRYGKGWVPDVPGMKRADQRAGTDGLPGSR